jgi:chromosome segregation ATPase
MGFESFSNPVPPQESETKVENNEEKEKLTKELENENASITYCENRVREDQTEHSKYTELMNTVDANGTLGGFDYGKNKKQAETYHSDMEEWQGKLVEHRKTKSEIEQKLGELS